jgi:sulfite reductase (NADPH) flavoprotein alpha-component
LSSVSPIELPAHPLAGERRDTLNRALDGLSPTQLAWVSGYIAALADQRAGAAVLPTGAPGAAVQAAPPGARSEAAARPTVLYASQTGTGKRIAEQLAASLTQAGVEPRLCRASEFPVRELARERLLYVVISTHGDGDPPDDSRAFLDFLMSKRAPRLGQLEYAVLALGDSSYPQFCATGRALDARLAALGAKSILPRVDSDVDVERYAEPWLRDALAHAREFAARSGVATVTALRGSAPPAVPVAAPTRYDRNHPYEAAVLVNQVISGRGAAKPVHHLELALAGEGLGYEPGDALAVIPRNPARSVEALLLATRLDGTAPVERDGVRLPLAEWLATRAEITRIARPVLVALAERNPDPRLARLLGPEGRETLRDRVAAEQVADFLADFPADWTPESLVAALRPLAHRAYSIASSRQLVGDEVHLTVALVGGENPATPRWGAASAFLAGLTDEARVPVFIERNERFRLPADPSRDIIMIGAGTGVAPYRGFLQEREAMGARGRNWLIFGGRNFLRDFLYQSEWIDARRRGVLQRIDLAFSRDQSAKIYVQQRLREQARELYAWLDGGASLYVCGDATRMAPDVHAALIEVVATQAGLDPDGARAKVEQWMADGRYLRDVY